MDDKGHLTGWTAFLLVAGTGLALIGGWLAPDGKPSTWLLVGAYIVTFTAANNIYRKVRGKVTEREIREDERSRITGLPRSTENER